VVVDVECKKKIPDEQKSPQKISDSGLFFHTLVFGNLPTFTFFPSRARGRVEEENGRL
jgi:hypothetical protein